MSTKTTFKRISLVAVAALGFGMVAAVPSFATATTTVTASVASASTYSDALAAVTNVVTITGGTSGDLTAGTVTAAVTTKPTGSVATPTWSSTGRATGLAATTTYAAGVASIGATVLDTSGGSAVGTVSFTPDVAGKYILTVTPAALGSGTQTAVTFIVWASGAAGTVATAGAGTTAISATVGGQAKFAYTTPNGTATGTVYQIQSTGVGSIVGATGLLTDLSTAENPVPYNGTAGDFSAGAKWTTGTNTTPHQGTFTLQSASAGTQTVAITKIDATTGSPTAVTSVVVTWGAAPTISAANSTSVIDSTTASTFGTGTVDEVISVDGTVATTRVATIKVLLKDSVKNAVAAKTLTAVITGPGLIQGKVGTDTANTYTNGSASGSRVATVDTDALGQGFFAVFSDGSGGVGTITISQGTTVISTETITFAGIATQLKNANLDTDKSSLNKVYIGVKETGTLKVSSADVNGNKVSSSPTGLVVTSDSTTVATVSISGGTGDITVTGVAVGKANITVSVGALATATIKLVFPVEITKTTAKTVSMSFDKATYAPGEKMTLTVKAVDSNGSGVADGARVLFADTATANVALGTLPTGTVTLAGGIKTYTYYAPFAAGDITVTATEGAAVDAVIASTTAAPYTAAILTAKATVVNASADAATDAANEATDAANAATDAALAAADAADAATMAAQDASDAVAALSASVSKLIASLKAQITTLTNLVIKIQKKVKA